MVSVLLCSITETVVDRLQPNDMLFEVMYVGLIFLTIVHMFNMYVVYEVYVCA